MCLLEELVRIALEGNPLKALKSTMRTAGAAELKKYLRTKLPSIEESKSSFELNDRITGNKMNLRGMTLKELPSKVYDHSNIQELDISKNSFFVLDSSIVKLSKLVVLCATDNQLTDLPDSICSLPSLKVLQASSNKIRGIFKTVSISTLNAMNLQLLDLSGNELSEIPSCLRYMPKLDSILLANNQILSMQPLCRVEFKNLSILDVSSNKLDSIPNSLSSYLIQLQQFSLKNNSITKVPCNLFKMEKLKTFSLEGNPIKSIRYDIIQKGTGAVLDFLKKMYNPDNDTIEEPMVDYVEDQRQETPIEKKVDKKGSNGCYEINKLLVSESALKGEIQKLSDKLKLTKDPGEKADLRKAITAKSIECNQCEAKRKLLSG